MKKTAHVPPPAFDDDDYKLDGYKTTVIMLRVTPEEKAAWLAAMALVRNTRNLSKWLRDAAAHFVGECEARHQRNEAELRAEEAAYEKAEKRLSKQTLRQRGKAIRRLRKLPHRRSGKAVRRGKAHRHPFWQPLFAEPHTGSRYRDRRMA